LAAVPRPIGIDRTLVDIATGIGMSARLLPGLSMSETGAVAVKSAKVRIEFAMARATSNKSDTVELGVRTFAIAARQSSAEFSNKASNNGVIELEIVAIAATGDRAAGVEPVRPEPVKPPAVNPPPNDDPKKKQREAIVRAIELLALPPASAALDDADRRIFDDFLGKAKAALVEGDLDTSAGWLQEIQKLLDGAARKATPRARATAPGRRKPAPRTGGKG
jgi:hypothetical protein